MDGTTYATLRPKQRDLAMLLYKLILHNVIDDNGNSPLHLNAIGNRYEVIKELIDRGANPNVRDNRQRTPLMLSSNLSVTDCLLKYKADPNLLDIYGNSALLNALYLNDSTIVESLLKAGAGPNYRLSKEKSPLIIAAKKGNKTIIELLTGYGAYFNGQEEMDRVNYFLVTTRQ
ncbi:ankyrin repeat domain-containing protein [Paenibacillus ihumii]|uniref:ankyrin repeat domain-containing protein n=1 Tax=Paenibacillus ihumii TaxID=687436 RepID=UPI0006D80D88|nr:ankyrin repeat domain-containing protein [Paenibacillus ihumii]